MQVKVEKVGDGLHPSEAVVTIETLDGPARLVVDKRSVQNGFLNVGYPIEHQGADLLVELPRETTTGSWRVWVGRDKVQAREMAAAD